MLQKGLLGPYLPKKNEKTTKFHEKLVLSNYGEKIDEKCDDKIKTNYLSHGWKFGIHIVSVWHQQIDETYKYI